MQDYGVNCLKGAVMQAYELKDSGVDWISDIPNGWKIDRLKDIANINEKSLETKTPDDYLLKYIEISNVNSRGIISEQAIEEIEFSTAPSRARRKVFLGDTIISSVRPNLQAIAYIESNELNLICSTGFYVVSSKFNYLLDNKFIYYFLLSESSKQYFESIAKGVGYPAVDDKDFKSLYLTLPPLTEQKTIADYLDQACQSIDKTIILKQQQLDKLEAYRKSVIHEAVTKGLDKTIAMKDSGVDCLGRIPEHWKFITLKSAVSKTNSGVTPKGGSESYVDEGIPLIRSQNVRFSGLDLSDVVFITEETHYKMANSKVHIGDVLLNITGASLGRCAFVANIGEANVNQHVCILRPYPWIKTEFLYYLLLSEVGQAQIFSSFTGSGREGLNFEAIKNFKLPLPEKQEQISLVNYLNDFCQQLDKTKQTITQQIKTLAQYRQSLIHECVTGKKRVYQATH